MRNPLYLRQLKRDLKKWVEEGILGAEDAAHMLETAGTGSAIRSLPSLFAILGVILLGFAAISYIAANFWAIPRTALLGLFVLAMCTSYGAATFFLLRAQQALGQAAALLGAILFGVNIMLIAQMYHISAHYPDGVMMWAFGALLTALLVPSRATLGLAFSLGGIWTFLETTEFEVNFHWQFIAFWAVATLLTHLLKWRPGFHLALLTLALWFFLNIADIADELDWTERQFFVLAALIWFFAWSAGLFTSVIGYPYGLILVRYGQILFLLSFFILKVNLSNQVPNAEMVWTSLSYALSISIIILSLLSWRLETFKFTDFATVLIALGAVFFAPELLHEETIPIQWTYSGIYLLTCIWLVAFGTRHNDAFTINWGLVAFGWEILYIYFETFDSLLSQSGFFAAGGVLLIFISILLDRLRRRLLKKEQAPNEAEASQ